MSQIEQLYQSAIDQMSPRERVARAVEMFNWARELMGRQVRDEHPEASVERLKLPVALRMYGNNPGMKTLIEGLLSRVSD